MGCGGYLGGGGGGGYEKNPEPLRDTKKTTEPLGEYQNLNTIGTEKNYIL